MPFSEHLKSQPKPPPLPWPIGIAVWFAIALGNYFFYAWLWIAVEGSSSSLSNGARTVAVMQNTALSVSVISFAFLIFRMQRSALFTLMLVLPVAFISVLITN